MAEEVRVVEGLSGARSATGTIVVVDVLRAFTTAAYAFAEGIEEIEVVATVEEAMARPGFRLGEVGGRLIPGFDHNNSPSQLIGKKLSGRAVLRTGAGAQCAVVAAPRATSLWLASLVVASATVRAIRGPGEVTIVLSGYPDEGEEDRACSTYMEALLRGEPPPRDDAIRAVLASRAAAKHRAGDSDRPIEDLDCATAVDAFDFAMKVETRESRLVAKRVYNPS
ncbi:MAG: 2-phosphosulfolactate phosphatase [Planctomycetes bacterium]|nr:2-phosphosulfolactate phosphatase [Planctomycetota bacterium]